MKDIIGTVFKQYGGSIAVDAWTDKFKKMTYFGVTLHYISQEKDALVLNDRIMVIRELKSEKKEGEYLRGKIYEYLNEYGLMNHLEKIVFVSDRGTNVVKAVGAFKAINCFAHLIHNVVEKMLHENPIVRSVSNIVKYFKASALHAIYFERSLKSYVSTRWNTVYTMLESVINNWTMICDVLTQKKTHLKDLQSITLDQLIMMKEFLEPFKNATLEVEATKHPTIDHVQPLFNELMHHLSPNSTDPSMIARLKDVGYAYWMVNVQNHITIYHEIAVFLNPLCKSLKCSTSHERSRVWSKTAEMMELFAPMQRKNGTQQPAPTRAQSRRITQAMSRFMDDVATVEDDDNELEEYKTARVTDFVDILQWWQSNRTKFPRLYIVARFIFSIPASSAAAERLFSKAGRLVNHRPNIRSELVDEILFLNSNFDFIENKNTSPDFDDVEISETIDLGDADLSENGYDSDNRE